MKNASHGVFVCKNGTFTEQEGFLGVDYFSRPSLKSAKKDKLINGNWGSRPNQSNIKQQIIRENMDSRGECFNPWSRGGWIAGKKEKGTLIKFSGYMYVRTGRGGAVGYLYPSEEI